MQKSNCISHAGQCVPFHWDAVACPISPQNPEPKLLTAEQDFWVPTPQYFCTLEWFQKSWSLFLHDL